MGSIGYHFCPFFFCVIIWNGCGFSVEEVRRRFRVLLKFRWIIFRYGILSGWLSFFSFFSIFSYSLIETGMDDFFKSRQFMYPYFADYMYSLVAMSFLTVTIHSKIFCFHSGEYWWTGCTGKADAVYNQCNYSFRKFPLSIYETMDSRPA